MGASKRDASRHLCQHVDDNEPIEWRELRTHCVVRNTQIRAPRRSIHIIGYMLVLHRGCRCSMHPHSKFDWRALLVASYQLCSCRVEVRVDPFPKLLLQDRALREHRHPVPVARESADALFYLP